MVSGSGKTHVATLVERTSRYVQTVKLENKTTDCVIAALTGRLQLLPKQRNQSLTWDRGLEIAQAVHRRHRHASLLLRTHEPLAARLERIHRRPAPAVPAARHEPQGHQPRPTGRDRPPPQQPAAQDPGLHDTPHASSASCCSDPLDPPGLAARRRLPRLSPIPPLILRRQVALMIVQR